MAHWVRGTGLTLMIILSILIGLHAVGFQLGVSGDPSFHLRFAAMPVAAAMHVIGGAVVLFTGGFQFWRSFRRRFPQFHRWSGRLYLSFVLIGGTGGLLLAPHSDGGLVAHVGFGLLAMVWLFSGFQAWRFVRAGNIKAHQHWMMRNYALTFAAVTLRIYLGVFAVMEVPMADSYPLVAWLCWVPNLILIEWYLALVASRQPAKLTQAEAPGEPFVAGSPAA